MLQIGNGTLTDEENRTHFSLWAILNAPLFAGTDLTRLTPKTRRTLTNREVIAIDQDFAGSQGRRLVADADLEVWGKPLSDGGFAVALYNKSTQTRAIRTDLVTLGLVPGDWGWTVRDLWAHRDVGQTLDAVSGVVPGHGVALYRLTRADRAASAAPVLDATLSPASFEVDGST